MATLGAIFAGGASRRFGRDKAMEPIGEEALLDRVARQLRSQVDALVVVGRAWPGLTTVPDVPGAGLGPLGALAGALAHAAATGFDRVLTSGCDLPDLPDDLVTLLGPAPGVLKGQPLVGLWPAELAGTLAMRLAKGGDRAMRGWVEAAGARIVAPPAPLHNLNTPAELHAYLAGEAPATRTECRRSSR